MSTEPKPQLDPVFVHSRRETIVLLVAFVVFFLWSVGASYFLGYGLKDEEITRTVMGIPHWVFWGVGVPWMAANVFTFAFCLFYMADDPLGEELDEVNHVGERTDDNAAPNANATDDIDDRHSSERTGDGGATS